MINSKYLETEKDVYNDILKSLHFRLDRNTQAINKINKLTYTMVKYNDEEILDSVNSDIEMYEIESKALKLAIVRIGYLANYKKMIKKLKTTKV